MKLNDEGYASYAMVCLECGMATHVKFRSQNNRADWHIELGCAHRTNIAGSGSVLNLGRRLDFVRLLLTDKQADALAKFEEAIDG